MKHSEISALFTAIKLAEGDCLDMSRALEVFLRDHPEIDKKEARAVALGFNRCPFPSIAGNPPVDRSRPYYDKLFWDRYED